MKALLVLPRLPGTGFTGDRVRAGLHLAALARAGFEVTAVCGVRGAAGTRAPAGISRLVRVSTGGARLAPALVRLAISGDPLQCALFAGPWSGALADAGRDFDLVDVVLPRTWPFVRGLLPKAPLVVDYIDALSEAARLAASRETSAALRSYWSFERPRLLRLERSAGEGAALKLATTPLDAAALPAGTRALSNGVAIGAAPGPAGGRGRVVAFSGRLGYRPNVLAMERLLARIWPLVRSEVGDAVLAVGGADAPAWLRRLDGVDGVSLTSPVPSMPAFLRAARAAALPVEMGTGTPNKLFEAFEAGTPAVAPPELLERALGDPNPGALPAREDGEFAARLVDLLRDDTLATSAGLAARTWVERHASREVTAAALAGWLREAAGTPAETNA